VAGYVTPIIARITYFVNNYSTTYGYLEVTGLWWHILHCAWLNLRKC